MLGPVWALVDYAYTLDNEAQPLPNKFTTRPNGQVIAQASTVLKPCNFGSYQTWMRSYTARHRTDYAYTLDNGAQPLPKRIHHATQWAGQAIAQACTLSWNLGAW